MIHQDWIISLYIYKFLKVARIFYLRDFENANPYSFDTDETCSFKF